MATAKKVTKVGGDNTTSPTPKPTSSPKTIDKGKAGQLRLFAVISWILALVAEAGAIYLLLTSDKANEASNWFTWLIVLIVADLIFVIVGSLLWKKANRFDPATRADKARFFIQNQLGVIMAAIAFLPLIILIFTNKDLSGNQKKLLGGIAVVAVLIAGFIGIDFDPPSLEEYANEASLVNQLTGGDTVYWTASGTRYHIYDDCRYINTDRTTEIFQGTVADAHELKNIEQLCSACETKARKAVGMEDKEYLETEDLNAEESGSILGKALDMIGN